MDKLISTLSVNAKNLRTLIDQNEQLVVLLSKKGIIRDLNRSAEIYFHATQISVLGKNFFTLCHIQDLSLEESTAPVSAIFLPEATEREIRLDWVFLPALSRRGRMNGMIAIGKPCPVEEPKEIDLGLESIIALLPGHVYWVDKKGVMLGCNDTQAQSYGYRTRHEIIGKSLDELTNKTEANFLKKVNQEVMDTGKKLTLEEPGSYHGERQIFLSHKVPLRNQAGEIIGTLGISFDITARKRAEKELSAARERIELVNAENKAKSEFVALISHELRTPLNGIMGMAQILSAKVTDAELKSHVDDIYRTSNVLLTLINDILDFSKLEAGKLDFKPVPFDLRALVEETMSSMSVIAAEKKLELLIDYAENIPRHVVADSRRIRQILFNFIGNAIKFTEEGHIIIGVQCLKTTEEMASLKLYVKDTGLGIPPDKHREIFDRFKQLEPTYKSKHRGTGLGLAIVKQIVEMMGGECGVESALRKGSTFWCELSLPIQTAETAALSWRQEYANMRVLIVDDNSIRGEMLKKQIGLPGCESVNSETVLEALVDAYNEKHLYEVVLIDDEIAFMGEMEMAKTIAAQTKFKSPSLILLSQPCPLYKVERAQRSGYCKYLIKPIQPTELINLLTHVWKDRIEQKKLQQCDLGEEIKVLVVEDNRLNQKIAKAMLEDLGCKVHIAETGTAALSMLNKKYDLIFMDVGLGDVDGYGVTAEIRRREVYPVRSCIIAMTAHAFESDKRKCLSSGMDDVLIKPVNHQALKNMLIKWLPQYQGRYVESPVEV